MDNELLQALSGLLDEKLGNIEKRFDKQLESVEKKFNKQLESMEKKFDKQLTAINNKLDETYLIVKALEHSAEVSKAVQDNMVNDIAHIKGDVEALRKDLTNVEVITASNWADIAKLKAVK
ncbi:MAG: hypothetical protein Q8936_08215 [Bacillota bacterium]|nr:hypothetical protein [Bacillota bacterium]